ncbi:MAG: PepSY domain-containing protein, partial [Sphingobacteriales bacterium]
MLWQLLHRYAGLFIAPFIFVAAFTGMLYAITPALENWLYQDQLTVQP